MISKNQNYKTVDDEEEYYLIVKKVFERLVHFYDLATGSISRVREEVLNFTNARKALRILDVGIPNG